MFWGKGRLRLQHLVVQIQVLSSRILPRPVNGHVPGDQLRPLLGLLMEVFEGSVQSAFQGPLVSAAKHVPVAVLPWKSSLSWYGTGRLRERSGQVGKTCDNCLRAGYAHCTCSDCESPPNSSPFSLRVIWGTPDVLHCTLPDCCPSAQCGLWPIIGVT